MTIMMVLMVLLVLEVVLVTGTLRTINVCVGPVELHDGIRSRKPGNYFSCNNGTVITACSGR